MTRCLDPPGLLPERLSRHSQAEYPGSRGDFDLFNDGTLKLVMAPGHAPGQQVLIIDLPNRGRVCLVADTDHQRDMVRCLGTGALAMSTTRMRRKQLERSGVPLFFCHDPDDFSKLPQGGRFWD
jgi:N-acyl homoserine lactone hydrolase